ncbi:MAG: acyl-CoA carboxylase subunit epsilon [Pseudonocardia sp.]|nr:acyl-CoA carboxylase subunit epsilon [Pseudonocardia sp.]
MSSPEERRALLRVVRGDPSDEELAALTVVLAVAASGGAAPARAVRDRWSDPAIAHRVALTPGPGMWRTTYWPR